MISENYLNKLNSDDLENLFNKQSDEIKKVNSITNDNMLYLYKYYKQVTVGNINIKQPGFFDFKNKAKYEAWSSVKDVSKNLAMRKYILKTLELL